MKRQPKLSPSRRLHLLAIPWLLLASQCGPSGDAAHPARTPLADKWFVRATNSYKSGDFEDANVAVKSAHQASPNDPEIKTLGARIALTRLEFAEALRLTEGLQTSEVHAIRGRAHWYQGDLEQAADELEAMLQDPTVKDNWAREVATLARRGQGRHPFAMKGGLVAAIDMPQAGPALIVPCELEGESILALIATASGEVVIDSSTRHEPAWVNLRFGGSMEVNDVPALTQDLSGISHQLGAPIKALLGVNLLRHTHVTFDRRGDQFVVRKQEPPPPPEASRVPLWYIRGGGMVLRGGVGSREEDVAPLLVDTAALFPLGLEDALWRRAGVDISTLKPEPAVQGMKSGTLPTFKIGGFDLPKVPAVQGAMLADIKSNVDVDLGGVVGAGLLYLFRVTLADDGHFMWIEPDPTLLQGPPAAGQPPPPPSPVQGAPGAGPSPSSTPLEPDDRAAPPQSPAKPGSKPGKATPPAKPGATSRPTSPGAASETKQ